jgi:hypothetical protein
VPWWPRPCESSWSGGEVECAVAGRRVELEYVLDRFGQQQLAQAYGLLGAPGMGERLEVRVLYGPAGGNRESKAAARGRRVGEVPAGACAVWPAYCREDVWDGSRRRTAAPNESEAS